MVVREEYASSSLIFQIFSKIQYNMITYHDNNTFTYQDFLNFKQGGIRGVWIAYF